MLIFFCVQACGQHALRQLSKYHSAIQSSVASYFVFFVQADGQDALNSPWIHPHK